ncbi:hypothetical protein [Williamsia serinedens]|uniref:DUF2530 domain-containing protein n=1 Tax=Williamsia serinedens TaxID=391736 RepID=A0ABT1GZG7_9NOCA|nr:hypothetical protein [Williamsia serinedens]MCP2160393.1 hypothetical protein [Williamsia serinedens]
MAERDVRGPVDLGQVVVGVIAFVVAVWGLLGAPSLEEVSVLPWIAVGVAGVVGVGLIVGGSLRSRRR